MKKRLVSHILTFALLLGLFGGALPQRTLAAGFTDTSAHWAWQTIDRWVGLGVLKGVSDTTFAPDRAITRAEFLTMINRTFGATQMANISAYSDVPTTSWYYTEIARAVRMGTTTGTSATTMTPNANVSRQDAVVILARALGLSTENTGALQTFNDGGQVATYARQHVASFVSLGYLNGYNGSINPGGSLTRAEAVTMLDNIFKTIVTTSTTLSGSGSVLVLTPGVTLSGTVNGDLILADGIGTGDVTLNNCTISGRLVIRGGGQNSVMATNTTARGGVFLQNPTGTTRLVLTNSNVGDVTAKTGLILDGGGVSSVTVPADVVGRPLLNLSAGIIDSLSVSSPAALELRSGTITNVYFHPGADNSTADIASGARANYMRVEAPNVSVTGTGTVTEFSAGATGAKTSMTPKSWYIDDNLSAVIGGTTQWGRTTGSSANNVSRSSTTMEIGPNASRTGGTGIQMSTSAGANANVVSVWQSTNTRIPLVTRNSRMAYWVGFFIPSPNSSTTAPTLHYDFDGVSTSMSVSTTTKDGQRGIELYIPVTRFADNSDQGSINTSVYINWNSGNQETINFSGTLNLQTPSTYDESTLVGYFRNASFRGYNGTTYSGTEAIRRLLLSDNPLGLNTTGFKSLSAASTSSIASTLNSEKALFTSKEAIAERLLVAMAGEGIFYAINRAVSAEQVKSYIEFAEFGSQLGIEDSVLSKYFTLSQVGRLSVARTVLLSRGTDYASEEALRTVFLAAVDAVRASETQLIVDINAARTNEEMKKLLENKANSVLLDIVTDDDPYKSLTADQKTAVAAEMIYRKPFATLDAVNSAFISIVGSPSSGGPVVPPTVEKVVSVSAASTTLTVEVGETVTIDPVVTTDKNVYKDSSAVTFTPASSNVIVEADGTVTGLSKGSAKVTLTSVKDASKKTTVTVNVVEPITATGITLSVSQLDVTEGGKAKLRATLTPANSTTALIWGSDDSTIASVQGTTATVDISGVKPGVTQISVRAANAPNVTAACTVVVLPNEAGVTLYPEKVTVGIETSATLSAAVSPLTLSDRTVKWSIADTSIATIDSSGKVTGKRKGVTTVTATSVLNGKSATCEVTVDDSIRSLVLNKDALTLYRGGAEIVEASIFPPVTGDPQVTWNYDKKYVSLAESENGRKITVVGVAAGKTTLTASYNDDATGTAISAVCDIEVLSTSITVKLSSTALKMNIGDTQFLTCTFTPSNIANKSVTWRSGNESIATVDQSGNITAVGKGETRIYALPQASGDEIFCTVTVSSVAVTSITVPSSYTLTLKNQTIIPVTILPANATVKSVIWESPNENVIQPDGARVTGVETTIETKRYDANGVEIPKSDTTTPVASEVKTDKPLTLKVTVVDYNNNTKTANCSVSVTETAFSDVGEIYINLDTWVFPVGNRQNLEVIFNKGQSGSDVTNRKVTWDSTNTNVAVVDESGYLQCLNPGETTIRVRSEAGGKTDEKQIVVANVGLEHLNPITGLSTDPAKGAWLSMTVGQTRQLTAVPATQDATDKTLFWSSEQPNIASVRSESVSGEGGNLVNNGFVTANAPGWAKIVVQPAQTSRYGTPIWDSELPDVLLAESRLTRVDDPSDPNYGKYRGPNRDVNGDYTYHDSLIGLPLVVKNKIVEGAQNTNNVFYVFVAPADSSTVHSFSFADAPGKTVGLNGSAQLTAALNWGDSNPASASPPTPADGVVWTAEKVVSGGTNTDATAMLSGGDRATTGGRARVTFNAGADSGKYIVTAAATVPEIKGTNDAVLQAAATLTASYEITVAAKSLKKVELTGATPNMIVYSDDGIQLGADIFLGDDTTPVPHGDANIQSVTWSSNNNNVAVDQTGKVTLAPGGSVGTGVSATITVTVTDIGGTVKAASVNIIMRDRLPVASVSFEGLSAPAAGQPYKMNAVQNEAFTLTAVFSPAEARPVSIVWTKVSDPNNILIWNDQETGLTQNLFASAAGTATIKVTIDGKEAECEITVAVAAQGASAPLQLPIQAPAPAQTPAPEQTPLQTPAPESAPAQIPIQTPAPEPGPVPTAIRLRASAGVTVGRTLTLTPYLTPYNADTAGLKWTSSNAAVATVENGTITGVKAGSAKITVTGADGKLKAACTVVVRAADSVPVTSVTLSKTELTLNAGAASTLKATLKPAKVTFTGVTWSSSDETVARVEPTGRIVGVAAGTAVITAVSDSGGHKASCTVTVVVPVTSLTLPAKTLTMKAGETAKLIPTINPGNATDQTLTFKSSNASVVSVEADGTVTAKKAGRATITVTAANGKRVTCTITVQR